MPRQRKPLSLSEKLKLLKKVDENPGMKKVDLAKQLNLAVSTLSTVIYKRRNIEKQASVLGVASKKTRIQEGKYPQVERLLLKFFQQQQAANSSLNGPMLMARAKEIASEMKIDSSFLASSGWLTNFKERHGIVFKKVCGDSNSANSETVNNWIEDELPELIAGYRPCDVFNADETGLFFKLLPDNTLAFKNEKCHNGKKSKDRVTVLLCANADGSEKLQPLVIGKYNNPQCFKNIVTLPTKYAHNNKAWITTILFKEWLSAWDAKLGCQRRKIVLFVDHCFAHPPQEDLHLRNINIKFFPSNCACKVQPMEVGIIENFKVHYRKRLVEHLNAGRKEEIVILQAMNFIAAAWRLVTPNSIKKSFVRAGFNIFYEVHPGIEILIDEESEIDSKQWQWPDLGGKGDLQDYVTCDDSVITSASQSIDQLVEEMSTSRAADDNELSSEDEDRAAMRPTPKFEEALAAWEIVAAYGRSHELTHSVEASYTDVYNSLFECHRKSVEQLKISDFFQQTVIFPNL